MNTDLKLQRSLYSELRSDDEFRYADIRITVQDRIAIIQGTVERYEQKARVFKIASQVPGLIAILEELEVSVPMNDRESNLKAEDVAGWSFI